MNKNKVGQYGKQNPLFMYQGTEGYTVKAVLDSKAEKEIPEAYKATPPQSGENRCGAL